jgi:tRNA-specific 2-thiouridylase
MQKQKVVVGMSGGVDSSVAAALLLEQGYEVYGVYLECYNEPGCRTDEDKADALKVAIKLGINFEVLDLRAEYKKKVVEYFYREYEAGRTPNPDVVCNREVKFGIFYDWAREKGYEYIATGHYGRIIQIEDLRYIQRAADLTKDQSYFLYQVPQEHLPHILFPLGDKQKKAIRELAHELGLPNADKPDSMGVCMMGELNVHQFLREKLGERKGQVVMKGEVVGQHKGLWFHTIGQRGGFEIDKQKLKQLGYHPEKMGPLYVVEKITETNQLVVGERQEIKRNEFRIKGGEWYLQLDKLKIDQLFVRIRNLGELSKIKEMKMEGETVKIITQESVLAVAEGQAAVIYATLSEPKLDSSNEIVVGGGEIAL